METRKITEGLWKQEKSLTNDNNKQIKMRRATIVLKVYLKNRHYFDDPALFTSEKI